MPVANTMITAVLLNGMDAREPNFPVTHRVDVRSSAHGTDCMATSIAMAW